MTERLHRFFVPPEWLHGDRVLLKDPVARQVARVLRMSTGDRVVLLDNTGTEYLIELTALHADGIEGRTLSGSPGQGEPSIHITLYQSLLKGDKMDWVLQKGTELGASAFVPLLSRRSVSRPKMGEQQAVRWRRIVSEAAEQSGRSVLPQVHPLMSLPEACQQHASGLALIPYENERECSLRGVLHGAGGCESVSLFIGPEGGWDPEEVALAHSNDVVPVSLGQRILRAETAAVAAITAVMYSQGELGR